MSHHFQLVTKEIVLSKDTPESVIAFLNAAINNTCDIILPDHDLFKEVQNMEIFSHWAWYDSPTFCCVGFRWRLTLRSDFKNHDAAELFAKWIAPYVAGHKPKEYIGWYKSEDHQWRINLYIERIKKPHRN